MNEPITGGDIPTPDVPLAFELKSQDRATTTKNFAKNWADILVQCENDKILLSTWYQNESPYPTQENEPVSALSSALELSGIYLVTDKANGVYATPFKYVDTPWKRALLLEGLKRRVTSNLLGFNDDPVIQKLAAGDSIVDYAAGSAVRPTVYAPLRDASRLTAFPPLSAVASQVVIQAGQLVLPDYKANEKGDGPHPWADGDEILLGTAKINEQTEKPTKIAGGFKITDALWGSPIGVDFATLRAARYRVRTERLLVKEMLTNIQAGITGEMTKDIGLTGSTYPADVITEIVMLYRQQDFMVTSLFGNEDTVKKYLNIDRSKHYAYSGIRTTAGDAVGMDMYGKMPSNRLVYDTDAITIANDNLLAIDAMETGTVYLTEDTARQTAVDLERATAFSYTLGYLATLNTTDGEPRRLLT